MKDGLMRTFGMVAIVGLILAGGVGSGRLGAQKGSSTPARDPAMTPPSAQPTPTVGNLGDSPDKVHQEVLEAAREDAIERKKRIVKDSTKIVELATEVKTNVDSTATDQYSADTVRKTEEIEKLAHDIVKRGKK
jgi:hypothetical protein